MGIGEKLCKLTIFAPLAFLPKFQFQTNTHNWTKKAVRNICKTVTV